MNAPFEGDLSVSGTKPLLRFTVLLLVVFYGMCLTGSDCLYAQEAGEAPDVREPVLFEDQTATTAPVRWPTAWAEPSKPAPGWR